MIYLLDQKGMKKHESFVCITVDAHIISELMLWGGNLCSSVVLLRIVLSGLVC